MKNMRVPLSKVAVLLSCLVIAGSLLVPAGSVYAAATITVSRTIVAPGDVVAVNGYGYEPGDSVVSSVSFETLSGPQAAQAVATVAANGAFSITVTVPSTAIAGTATVTAQDFHGAIANKRVAIAPRIYLQPGTAPAAISVQAGRQFFVSGGGFGAAEIVTLRVTFPLYDGTAILVTKQVQTDTRGAFHDVLLSAPLGAKQGVSALGARGNRTGRAASGRVVVYYNPTVNPVAGSVRPGAPLQIQGRDFVPGAHITVSVIIGRAGSSSVTLSRVVVADGNGNFDTSLLIPSSAQTGNFTVSAVDSISGKRVSAPFAVSIHAVVSVNPASALPGETVMVSGSGFGSRVTVQISTTFPLVGGGSRPYSIAATSDNAGAIVAHVVVPSNAAPARVTLLARSANGQATTALVVRARPASTPTPIPTAAPAATATVPTSPVATITPKKHHGFYFKRVSLWYHTVRQGTFNYVDVQGSPRTQLGLWAHVYFPSGKHYDYYVTTDRHGHWSKRFGVPLHTKTSLSDRVLVTLRLWHGAKSKKTYMVFTLL
ncbi:MAG: hypothetical protein NVSMB52_15400 [Chloroflexota bacterium]